MRLLLLFMAMPICGTFLACNTKHNAPSFSGDLITNSGRFDVVLGFDLRNDDVPRCGLLIHTNATIQNQQAMPISNVVFLPFPSSSAEVNSDLFSAWGSTDCCTWISYLRMPGTEGSHIVALAPSFTPQPDNLSRLPGQIYLLKLGQERRFIYKYPNESRPSVKKLIALDSVQAPQVIAVVLPKAKDELQPFGPPIADPKPIDSLSTDITQYYAATAEAAHTDHLEIRYYVNLTSREKKTLTALGELVIAILTPLLALIFVDPSDPSRKRARKIGLTAGLIVEVIIVGILGYLVISSWSIETFEALSSLGSAIVGAIFMIFVLYAKRGNE